MNPQIGQEIGLLKEFVAQQNDLGIIIGSHQNLDTVAAALALYLSLNQAGKKVQIMSKKEPTVEFASLVAIDKIKGAFVGNTSKLVISLPYKKGEVEKVLFTEAPNTINFHLTAVAGQSITPFDKNDVKLNWEGGAPAAVITIGVGTIDEVSEIVDTTATKIVNIDNYQGNSRFGDVVLVDEMFSSLSEIIAKAIKDLGLPTDTDVAQNILDGVLSATRSFTKSNTSPLAFEAASAAMYQGAQRKAEAVAPQQQPRRDNQQQNFGGQNRQNNAPSQDRGNRGDQRPQQNRQPQQQRINENDFPAMHMQGQQKFQHAQGGQQQHSNNDRRVNNAPRNTQGNMPTGRGGQQQFGQNRPPQQNRQPQQQQFGQNPNDIEELMRKIKEENARHMPNNNQYDRTQDLQNSFQEPQINDAEIVEDTQMAMPNMNEPMNMPSSMPNEMPVEDVQIPENQGFAPQSTEEIPDDWLMPKVFKSSKNNN